MMGAGRLKDTQQTTMLLLQELVRGSGWPGEAAGHSNAAF
jgi:hypothetical protein